MGARSGKQSNRAISKKEEGGKASVFDPIAERNEKAYLNGLRGEQYALALFEQIERIDKLVDAKIGDELVEIKTCQEWQSNGRGRCRGRFVLDKEQHRYLTRKGGYYLFIVLMENGSINYRLVKASVIRFKRKLGWIRIFTPDRAGGDSCQLREVLGNGGEGRSG